MKLVQSQFLPRQATLHKYYALVTGVDCNPYNGPEAKATYDAIKNILMERSIIAEETCIRIYDNEEGFGLSRYSALGNDIEIQILLFAMQANNNGWTIPLLSEAFKKAKVPSIMRREPGSYSFDWYHPNGTPTFQVHLKDAESGLYSKLDRRHIHISSEPPLNNTIGRLNDYWIVVMNNTLYHWIKRSDGWKDITLFVDATEGGATPKDSAISWLKMDAPTVRKITTDGWETDSYTAVFANAEPADKSVLWWSGPANDLLAWHLHEYNADSKKWVPVHICACITRDIWTWFSAGEGTTFNILEDADALGGAALSLDPSAGGGAVEVYRINTDPSNLIGTAKKLVLDADAPDPYIIGADSNTVHFRSNPNIVQAIEDAYVVDVKPVDSRQTVTLTKDASGVVTAFTSTTANVEVYLTWIRKQGDFTSVPSINGVQAVPDAPRGSTGKIVTTFSGTTMNVIFNASTSPVKTTLLGVPSYVTGSTTTYEAVGQTHAKVNDEVRIAIVTNEPVQEIEVAPSSNFTVQGTTFSGNNVTLTLRNTSNLIADTYNVSYRLRKSGGIWSTDTTNTVLVDNVMPTFVGVGITAPAGITAVRPSNTPGSTSSTVDVQATFTDITGTVAIASGDPYGTATSITQSGNTVSFKLTPPSPIIGDKLAIKFTSTRVKNNSKLDATGYLDVVATAAFITPAVAVQLRSGMTNVINVAFDQVVTVGSVVFDNANVSITKGAVLTPQQTQSLEVVVTNQVPSSTLRKITWSVTGRSGMTTNIEQIYTINGFAAKTLTLTYPATIADIGTTITDFTKLVVSGKINSDPAFPIAIERVATPAELLTADQYCIIDNGTRIQVASQVEIFYYDATNNITLIVEQQ